MSQNPSVQPTPADPSVEPLLTTEGAAQRCGLEVEEMLVTFVLRMSRGSA